MFFQFHGWAVVHSASRLPSAVELESGYENEDKKAIEAIQRYLDEHYTFPFNLNWSNGLKILNTSGCSNHYRASPMQLFQFIRDTAAGAYGLLYVLDEENEEGWENTFQAWILRDGSLTRAEDRFLSPIKLQL